MERAFKTKKLWLGIVIIVIATFCAACFVACESGDGGNSGDRDTPHTHRYVNYVYNNDATCVADGTETSKCKYCEETDTRTKANTATGEHSYVKYVCTVCGGYSPNAPITDGLKYSEIKENDEVIGYAVTGKGSATDTDIIIPQSFNGKPITIIAEVAFENCKRLTSITIPNSVTSIENWAFGNCSGLMSVKIPNSVTNIGALAFSDCSSLTNITIPNSVMIIGEHAFSGCSKLTSIEIPSSVTSMGIMVFNDCYSLTSMTVARGNEKYHSYDNCIIETASNTLIAGCQASMIPTDGSVTSIGEYAFSGCSSLTSITIPNSVTSIGQWAFGHCSSLASINIPNSVTSIGDNAFSSCSSLREIEIPNSVTSFGEGVFYICSSLTNIEIPNSVTNIGYGTFSSCSSLTNIEIPNSITTIGDYAFDGCTGLTSIEIPNSVTSIGSYAFRNCFALSYIEIPSSVTSIGSYALRNCINLASIKFNGLKEQWQSIISGNYTWNFESSIETVVCDDGTITVQSIWAANNVRRFLFCGKSVLGKICLRYSYVIDSEWFFVV